MLEFIVFLMVVVFVTVVVSAIAWAVGSLLMRSKSRNVRCFGFKLYAESDLAKPFHVAERCPCTDEACKSCRYWTCSKFPYRKDDVKNEKQS